MYGKSVLFSQIKVKKELFATFNKHNKLGSQASQGYSHVTQIYTNIYRS